MNVTFNLNYLLVFGLAICIIILIFILLKYIFVPDNNSSNVKLVKKNLDSNIDFFNTGAKIIEKSNKIIDKENNKVYHFIDLGDKILIMENTLFIPQEENEKNENEILNSDSPELPVENDSFIPEQIGSDVEITILEETSSASDQQKEAEEMQKVIEESGIDYEEQQSKLYDYAVVDAEVVTSSNTQQEEEEEEEEEEEYSDDDDDNDPNKFI